MPTMTHEQACAADANDEMLALSAKLAEASMLALRLAAYRGVDMAALGLDLDTLKRLQSAAEDAYTLNRVVVTKF